VLLLAGEGDLVAGFAAVDPALAVLPGRVSAIRRSPVVGWFTITLIARYDPS